MDPKRSAPVEWSPSASERQLSPYEYLQFIQRKAVSENAVVSQGIMTRFQSFHLYWKTPNEQQLADYDIELAPFGALHTTRPRPVTRSHLGQSRAPR